MLGEEKYFRHKWSSVMNVRKLSKKCNWIKGRSITYSHIWYTKNMYWLDIHSMVVWWSKHKNAVLFCDIIFRLRTVLPTCSKNSLKNQSTYQKIDISTFCLAHAYIWYLFSRILLPESHENSGYIGLLFFWAWFFVVNNNVWNSPKNAIKSKKNIKFRI